MVKKWASWNIFPGTPSCRRNAFQNTMTIFSFTKLLSSTQCCSRLDQSECRLTPKIEPIRLQHTLRLTRQTTRHAVHTLHSVQHSLHFTLSIIFALFLLICQKTPLSLDLAAIPIPRTLPLPLQRNPTNYQAPQLKFPNAFSALAA